MERRTLATQPAKEELMLSFTTRRLPTILIGLLVPVVAGAASSSPQPLLDLIPPDSVAVAVVRWSELRASALYRDCEERFAFGAGHMGVDDFARVTGIDPLTDIDSLLIAARSSADGSGHGGAVGIASGRFQSERISAALTARTPGVGHRTDGDWSIYEFSHKGGGHNAAVAFRGADLVIFGDAASVSAARGATSRAASATDRELRRLIEETPHNGQAWGAVTLERIFSPLAGMGKDVPAPVAALQKVRWASFDADFAADLHLSVTASATSIDEAQILRQAIDGLIAFAKLGSSSDPHLAALLAETTIATIADRVTLDTTIASDVYQHFLSGPGSQAGRRKRSHH